MVKLKGQLRNIEFDVASSIKISKEIQIMEH